MAFYRPKGNLLHRRLPCIGKQGYGSAFLSVMGMIKYYVSLIVINQNNGVFDAVKCSFCNLVYIYNEINVGVVDGRNGNGGQMQARR